MRGLCATVPGFLAPLLLATTAHAGNFPPVAAGAAQPPEALLGEVIQFSSDDSFDPDDSPGPLTFEWDFGDGSPVSTLANPTHSYAALGLYFVTLRVSDGLSQTLVNVDVVVVAPPTAVAPAHSSSIAASPDDPMGRRGQPRLRQRDLHRPVRRLRGGGGGRR